MNNLISDGIGLMLLGMGFVYVFLCVLIVATGYMSKIINRYFPEPVSIPKSAPKNAAAPTSTASNTDPKIAAAIVAAIHEHRKK